MVNVLNCVSVKLYKVLDLIHVITRLDWEEEEKSQES